LAHNYTSLIIATQHYNVTKHGDDFVTNVTKIFSLSSRNKTLTPLFSITHTHMSLWNVEPLNCSMLTFLTHMANTCSTRNKNLDKTLFRYLNHSIKVPAHIQCVPQVPFLP